MHAVLVVQTPRPNWPFLKALGETGEITALEEQRPILASTLSLISMAPDMFAVRETGELLRPIFRFGIPETSVRNKCPYWR